MESTFGCPFKAYRVLYDYENGSQERLHTVNSSGHLCLMIKASPKDTSIACWSEAGRL